MHMRDMVMARWVVLTAVLVACKSRPTFVVPDDELGGVIVQCVSVTDFAERVVPCGPNLNPTVGGGGCACAQPGIALGRPPLHESRTFQLGVVAFQDPFCETDSPLTCVPNVIGTDPRYQDPYNGSSLPKGALKLTSLLGFQRGTRQHINDVSEVDVSDYAGLSLTDPSQRNIAQGVALDAANEVLNDCKIAHWSMLVQLIYGFEKGTFDWSAKLLPVATQYDAHTTGLNPDHFNDKATPPSQPWGTLVSEALDLGTNFLEYEPYTTALWQSNSQPCNANLKTSGVRGESWGVTAINEFNNPAPVANAPPMQGSGSVAPRQSVVLSNGSSALITVSGLNESPSVSISGGVEVVLTNCSGAICTAKLGTIVLLTGPFTLQGHDVAGLRFTSLGASSGSLTGTTLVFTGISGSVRATLTDGRYADMEVAAGVVLANWDVSTRKAVMAFALESTLSDGTVVTINGTAFGDFDNTAPVARISVASPPSTDVGTEKTVECQSPLGTDVALNASESFDREDGMPKLAWWQNDFRPVARKSTSTHFVLTNLPLGSQRILLMAYDSRGYSASERTTLTVVDTLPPIVSAPDICVFPPNKKEFCLRVSHELAVSASDQCEGDLSEAVEITNVTSSSGSGVVSVDAGKVCLIADRDGTGSGTTYGITLAATDAAGGVGTTTVSVTIPHDSRQTRGANSCLRPHKMGGEE